MDHKSKNTTPTNPSKKRKASRPKQKAKTQETSKTLQKECKSNTDKKSKDEEAPLQKVQKIKRTYGRKTPQHLPSSSVPTAPAEDSPSESSCSSPSSSGLTNGGQDSAQPPRRSSCKVEVKTGEPTSAAGGGKDAAAKKRRKVGAESKPSDEKVPKELKPAVSVAAAARNPKNQDEEKCLEHKEKGPAVKKDPPSYPPGSQEERWNLQIVAKGRVTCPKCKTVGRKTVEGLKKHMTNCKMNPFTCQHCGKQLKSLTGMKYHIMADHNNLPSSEDGVEVDSQSMKEKLRKVLKRMGKLKCSKEGCSGSFTSVMGYLYHTRKCGKQESELEKLVLNCRHCGKAYKSRAGLEYHLKSEHGPVSDHEQCPKTVLKSEDEDGKAPKEPNPERTPSGRVKRMSAQVAVFHLQELASEELLKEWPKRKVQRDLVPDDKKLKYARPGLPAFSQEVLRKWKNEVKLQRKVHCPNQGCDSVYTSVSGLKAHLGLCSRGDFEAGKYKCLICDKEFSSESGVKYHINSIHGQDWFVVSTKASKNFEKLLKAKPKQEPVQAHPARSPSLRFAPGHKGWRGQGPRVRPASGPKVKPGEAKAAASGREKDCYDFSGSDSPSSSDSSSSDSSSDSETDAPEAPRHDKWALKRPVARQDAAKRAQSNS